MSSKSLLEQTLKLVSDAGYRCISGDITIIAERPKLASFMPSMSEALSGVVGTVISVKATTTEGLGAIGRAEGIAASAVVLIEEK